MIAITDRLFALLVAYLGSIPCLSYDPPHLPAALLDVVPKPQKNMYMCVYCNEIFPKITYLLIIFVCIYLFLL